MKAKKCNCGAITVEQGQGSWSMTESEFKKHFPDLELEEKVLYCCNYCVNKWGISLCACGSGEHYKECNENNSDCGTPAQTLGEIKEYNLWN